MSQMTRMVIGFFLAGDEFHEEYTWYRLGQVKWRRYKWCGGSDDDKVQARRRRTDD